MLGPQIGLRYEGVQSSEQPAVSPFIPTTTMANFVAKSPIAPVPIHVHQYSQQRASSPHSQTALLFQPPTALTLSFAAT